jgi:hypothetical protein
MKGVFVPGGTPEEIDLSPEVRRALEAEIKSLCPHKETSTPVRHESGVKLTKCKKCGVYL